MTEGTTIRQGPIACPSNNFLTGEPCEYEDGICIPQGPRMVEVGTRWVRETSPVNLCGDNFFQNGDLDFDGIPYQATTWPDGSPNVPTSFRYAGPFDRSGQLYPQIQFETDVAGSEFLCHESSGFDCTARLLDARFYPFWSITNKKGQGIGHGLFPAGACVWNFGNTIAGVTPGASARTPSTARLSRSHSDIPGISSRRSGPTRKCPADALPCQSIRYLKEPEHADNHRRGLSARATPGSTRGSAGNPDRTTSAAVPAQNDKRSKY